MKQSFKFTGKYIYPIPIIKENKYLIECLDPQKALEIISSLESKKLLGPLENEVDFKLKEIHADGKTPIFILVQ